jgi:hypothetical protein
MGTRKRRTVMDDIQQANDARERITAVNSARTKEPLGAEASAEKPKRTRAARVSANSVSAPNGAAAEKAPRKRAKKGAADTGEQPTAPVGTTVATDGATDAQAATVAAADVEAPVSPLTAAPEKAPALSGDEIKTARAAAEAARKSPEKPLMGKWHGVRWERQVYVGAAVTVILSAHPTVTAKEMAQVIPEDVMPYRELCWVLDDLGSAAQLPENMLLKVGRATYSRPAA